MSKSKKPSKAEIEKELARAAVLWDNMCHAFWTTLLNDTAARLGVEPQDIEDDFGSRT